MGTSAVICLAHPLSLVRPAVHPSWCRGDEASETMSLLQMEQGGS